MPSGGPRNRSGPPPQETSARSDARGYSLQALPADGYTGEIPAFPLPGLSEREFEVWQRAWRSPQAWAWSQAAEDWRLPVVALWVRMFVRCEAPTAAPGLLAQLHRLADQIGMTTAGLREMGWKVAAEEQPPPLVAQAPRSPRRLRVVDAQ